MNGNIRVVLEEVTRLLNLEKHLPSYKYTVSVSCLKVIRKLQKCGHLPSLPKIYRCYAAYGQYIDVRIAAMECLVDFVKVDGRWEDLEHLLNLLESDPDPTARHALARLLIENPPFEKGQRSKLDKEELVERIWVNMNGLLSHDSKLRCDMVDLYYALYGIKRPMCLQSAELSAMFKPQKVQPVLTEPKSRPASPYTFKPVNMVSGGILETSNLSLKRPASALEEGEIKIEAEDSVKQEAGVDPEPPIIDIQDSPFSCETKKMKTEYYSENSASLPGMTASSGPVGFEPGMFKQEEDSKSKSDTSMKIKKKKKDKKKHKHKHKHKHNKEREKKEKKDPSISRIQVKEETPETLSSADSSSNSNPATLDYSL